MRTSWSSADFAKGLPFALVILLLTWLAIACDPLESFTVVNSTSMQIEVTLTITTDDNPDPLGEHTYLINPGSSIDTESDKDLSGDRGYTIFASRHLLVVRAKAKDQVIFERTFTYDELKTLDFRIEITEAIQP